MKTVMNNIPDDIEELYVNDNNKDTFNKYIHDDFLFSDITENIIGPINNYSGLSISHISDDYLGSGGYLNIDIINKIKDNIIDDFIDRKDKKPSIKETNTQENKPVLIPEINNITDNPNDVILNISVDNNHNKFFDCFNEENSVNNVIVCNNTELNHELATSYMFDAEDLRKNDIDPFYNQTYKMKEVKQKNKQKGWLESLGIITTSAILIFKNNDF